MVGKKCIRGDCRIGEGCLGVLEPFAQLVESMLYLTNLRLRKVSTSLDQPGNFQIG